MLRRSGFYIASKLAAVLLSVGLLSCAGSTQAPTTSRRAADTRTFSAALFPYIPDSGGDGYAALTARLEELFEKRHPGVDLRLSMDASVDFYDQGTLEGLLGSGTGAFDMVEVDTLLLGDLVRDGLIRALPFDVSAFGALDLALQASTVDSVPYGVPTYLCGNFIYSWDGDVRLVGSGEELIEWLHKKTAPDSTALVGNFKGSWTLPGFYVDDWADTHSNEPAEVATAFELPLDADTMRTFSPVVDLCGVDGGPCLDGTYKDNTQAESLFADKKAHAFVGYSERLFYILQARAKPGEPKPFVISAPLGGDSRPLFFVDALVLNPSCDGTCAEDAEAFSRFMSSLEVRNLIAFSLDVEARTYPRYLLQALASFYYSSPAREDVVYRQLRLFLDDAEAFPNQGFPAARGALNTALGEALAEDGAVSTAGKGKG